MLSVLETAGPLPTYTATLAFMSLNETLVPLSDAQYDYGTGHHNDALYFEYDNKGSRYYHSSFGSGSAWQEMDCMEVSEAGGQPIIENGCGMSRTRW